MRNSNILRVQRILIGLLLGLTLSVPMSADILTTLSVNQSSTMVTSGSSLAADVVISGLALPPEVGAFDIGISYDPTLLIPRGITFGGFLGDPLLFEALTASNFSFAPNVVEGAEVSLLSSAQLDMRQQLSQFGQTAAN